MPINIGDLAVYGSQSIAEDNISTQGGSINSAVQYKFQSSGVVQTLNDSVRVFSSSPLDTGDVTVFGRNARGRIIDEDISLQGTGYVLGSMIFERILKIDADTHSGVISVASSWSDIAFVGSGISQIRTPFIDVFSSGPQDYYEKIFIKNDGNLAFSGVSIIEGIDPQDKITFDLENTQDGSISTNSRTVVPTGTLSAFDNLAKSVPGSDMEPEGAIGVWLKFSLNNDENKYIFSLQASGI